MAIFHYNESSGGLPNSGRLSGTVGDWVGIADVAFVAAGWSIEFTATNQRVYRPPSGNRFRACFDETTATSGDARAVTFRGAESAVSAGSWTDPFPTVAQIANNASNLLKSSAANTTARAFDLWIWPTGFLLFVNVTGAANTWDMTGFGDIPSTLPGDSYNTVSLQRNSSVLTSVGLVMSSSGSTATSGAATVHWTRSYDGTVKSPVGGVIYPAAQLGNLAGAPPAQGGPSTGIDQEKVPMLDTGNAASTTMSATLGMPRRGYFPQLWLGMHAGPGSINTRDTWTNTTYNPSAGFQAVLSSGTIWVIIENTDTWSPPSG